MRCVRCKTENMDGSLLCVKCGASLSDAFESSKNAPVNASVAPVAVPPTQVASAAPLAGAPSQDVRSYEEGSKYKPSGRMGSSGLPLMLGAGFLATLVVGIVSGFISRWINLIFFSPLITGLCAGGILALAIASGKVRNPRAAGTIALLVGISTLGMMHFTRAMSLRGEMIDGMTQGMMTMLPQSMKGKDGKMHALTAAERGQMEARVRGVAEQELTPWQTLKLYEEVSAQAGTSLKHNGVGTGVPVKGNFYWLLRAVEAGALILGCIAIATGAASKPFCEPCDGWHKKTDVLKVHPTQNAELWEKIGAKNWGELLQTPVGQVTDSKNLTTLSITSCEKCGSGTLDASSTAAVPDEFKSRQLSPESTRFLLNPPTTPSV